MKTFRLVIGILITIGSSIYFLFALSIISMGITYGTKINTNLLILPIAFIILGIYLIVSANKEERNELKRYRQQEQKQREIYYPNKNYKAKDSYFYLMTPKQKLEYTYDRLPEKEQEKVRVYAENLLKQIENQKYEQKR